MSAMLCSCATAYLQPHAKRALGPRYGSQTSYTHALIDICNYIRSLPARCLTR